MIMVTANGVAVAGFASVAVTVGKIVFDVVTEGITVTVGRGESVEDGVSVENGVSVEDCVAAGSSTSADWTK